MNALKFAKLLKACDARIREIILMSFDGTEDEMSDEKHELLDTMVKSTVMQLMQGHLVILDSEARSINVIREEEEE